MFFLTSIYLSEFYIQFFDFWIFEYFIKRGSIKHNSYYVMCMRGAYHEFEYRNLSVDNMSNTSFTPLHNCWMDFRKTWSINSA